MPLTGKKRNREIVVEIYFAQLADDEADAVFDVSASRWRHKGGDEECND